MHVDICWYFEPDPKIVVSTGTFLILRFQCRHVAGDKFPLILLRMSINFICHESTVNVLSVFVEYVNPVSFSHRIAQTAKVERERERHPRGRKIRGLPATEKPGKWEVRAVAAADILPEPRGSGSIPGRQRAIARLLPDAVFHEGWGEVLQEMNGTRLHQSRHTDGVMYRLLTAGDYRNRLLVTRERKGHQRQRCIRYMRKRETERSMFEVACRTMVERPFSRRDKNTFFAIERELGIIITT